MAEKLALPKGQDTELGLSYMVVSNESKESNMLVNGLLAQQKHFYYELFVHSCNNLKEVTLYSNIKIHIDYCVFMISAHKFSLDEINENLRYLDKVFLLCRFCFVLIHDGPYQVALTNIKYLRETYKCIVLVLDQNGISNQDKWFTLAKQVMNVAQAACGVKTGISPYINLLQ